MNRHMHLCLEARWAALLPWQRMAALVSVACIGAFIAFGATRLKASRDLTPSEATGFSQWVAMTAEPAVAVAYAERQRDGRVTTAEVREIMEIAKAVPPGPGLAGP